VPLLVDSGGGDLLYLV